MVIDLIGKLLQEMHSENPKVGGTKAIGEFGIIAVPESQRRTVGRNESPNSNFEEKIPHFDAPINLERYYVTWSPNRAATLKG